MLGSLGGAQGGLDEGVCGICGADVKLNFWRLVEKEKKHDFMYTHAWDLYI